MDSIALTPHHEKPQLTKTCQGTISQRKLRRKTDEEQLDNRHVLEMFLCNIELPDDELIEVRKRRHADFHIDESVGTGKPKRNWTFGNAKFELVRIIESL